MLNTNDLLDTIKAAEILGILPRQVQKYCKRGDLGRKLGGRYLISKEELDKFVKPSRGPKVKKDV